MKNFNGPFKEDINNYIDYRINVKHQKLSTVKAELNQFDEYTLNIKATNELTKEIVENWLTLRKNENPKTLNKRLYTMRVFAKYLNMIGKKAFIISTNYYLKETKFVPHIYTDEEIKLFFESIDKYSYNSYNIPNKKIQMKLMFKILYCCGLRISECLNLKYEDINLNEGSIKIRNAKFNKSRLLFINEDLKNNLTYYINNYPNNKCDYIFYNKHTNNKINYNTINEFFKYIIKNSNLDKTKRYRIHDFRHTFAVTNIKKVFQNNENVDAFLPILMNYMGHSDIKDTEYYLRLTPDIYKAIISKYEKRFIDIFNKEVDSFEK
jgi:integrase/recombinase XerD